MSPVETHVARCADPPDLLPPVKLWQAGWMEANAKLVPPALVRLCMYEDFTSRIRAIFGGVGVIGHVAVPVTFHSLQDDELDHFFVTPRARGTGVAALLA